MGICRHCGTAAVTTSDVIGFCAICIREHFDQVWPEIQVVHRQSRRSYGLPETPPTAENGVECPLCFHRCRIAEGGNGFCGLRRVEGGKLKGGRPQEGNLSYYYDPLPTNCVADFVCPGGLGCGFPKYAVSLGPEYGHKNLAVFYQACSFNCLYCQNYHFKEFTRSRETVTAAELAGAVDGKTTCICYFGGDPSPQVLHALRTSSLALSQAEERILRICWETNGAMQLPFLKRIGEVSLKSGGCVKFDLKAWNDSIHHALCGVTNEQTLRNFKVLSQLIPKRPEPPFLIASTLLVPGYVDEIEVGAIAEYLAEINPEIPYRLLAFHPQFMLRDLPTTSRSHAFRCKEAAQHAGVRRVEIGNFHLLGNAYN